jgi:cellulose synthase/poly-beta-1,6-N-acetylglucosamine synthase-like glycosyltransferase
MDHLKLKDQTQESLLRESGGYPAIPREDVPRITDYSEATPNVAQPTEGQQTSLLAIPRLIVAALALVLLVKFGVEAYRFIFIYGLLVTAVPLTAFYVAFKKYKDPSLMAEESPENNRPDYLVSCLVAVRNEETIIEQCIESLINSIYENREIIIVNDASTDRTKDILDEYHRKGLIEAIHLEKNVGKKRALAKAILRSKGEIIAFSDSDSVLATDAISKIVEAFRADSLIGAVSGHCRALNANKNLLTKIQDSWYEGQFSVRKAFESVYGCVSCVSGPLAVFRREAIFNFIPAWENDSFLGQEFKFATDRTLTGFVLGGNTIGDKLKRKYMSSPFVCDTDYPTLNWKVVYSKSARAWTEVPDSFKKLIEQQIRWKKSFIRNMFFTGAFYWRKPFLPAFVYYVHIIFVLLGPFIAFRHLVFLPLQGNPYSLLLYLGGIALMGSMFGLACKYENKNCRMWIYRPLMSLLSTLVLSWLIFYSIFTIKKMTWVRG